MLRLQICPTPFILYHAEHVQKKKKEMTMQPKDQIDICYLLLYVPYVNSHFQVDVLKLLKLVTCSLCMAQ